MPRETELKFAVHGLFELPDLVFPKRGITESTQLPDLDLRATYWDTEDLRLAREGITLRHRTGEDEPRWTLKLPVSSGAALVRDEVELVAPATEVPADLADLVSAWRRGAALRSVATLRTRRRTRRLSSPAGVHLADVVDDDVSVLAGRRVLARFREVEVETAQIDDRALASVTGALEAAGAMPGAPIPKVVRALGAGAAAPPDLPHPAAVGPTDPAGAAVSLSLRTNTRRLLVNDVAVRVGGHDAVHQMRVACRRMRSDLRTFGPLVDEAWATDLRAELGWLAGELGPARDLEVLTERLAHTAAQDPEHPVGPDGLQRVLAVLMVRRAAADARALGALHDPRYFALVDRLVAAAAAPALTAAADEDCAAVLPDLVATTWFALAKKARRLRPGRPVEDFHRVRILAKRARYAAEATTPVLGRDPKRLADAVARVQEVLGEVQDAGVAAEVVLGIAAEMPDDGSVGVAAGRLAERELAHVRSGQDRFLDLWPRVDVSKVRGWLPS